jgi:hypothetical protein
VQHALKSNTASALSLTIGRDPRRTALVLLVLVGLVVAVALIGLTSRPLAPTTIAQEAAAVSQPRTEPVRAPATVAAAPVAPRCDPRTITGDLIYGPEGTSGGTPSDVYTACARLDRPAAATR